MGQAGCLSHKILNSPEQGASKPIAVKAVVVLQEMASLFPSPYSQRGSRGIGKTTIS